MIVFDVTFSAVLLLRSGSQRPLLFMSAEREGVDEYTHHVYGAAPGGDDHRLSHAGLASSGLPRRECTYLS